MGLLGFGVVGSAVYQQLLSHGDELGHRHGFTPVVRRVLVRDPRKSRPVPVPVELITTDAAAVLNDPAVDVVVEAMGGLEPARTYIRQALRQGKSVVTANKELMAEHGRELLALAAAHCVDLYYEASVGGGIPVLRPLRQALSADRLNRVLGIVNGTTNYILDRMTHGGQTFAAALAEAQARGYAEPDPTADVEGLDAARKIAILAGLAFHTQIPVRAVATAGITRITPEDIAYGLERDRVVKLIACAERDAETVTVWVGPAFLPRAHPLAGVGDAFNAIFVRGEEIGECMFYGRGAGGAPTASAVVGDLVTVARQRRRRYSDSRHWATRALPLRSAAVTPARYFLRLAGMVAPAALAEAGVPVAVCAARAGHTLVETNPVAWQTVTAALARSGAPALVGAIRLLS